MSSETVRKIMTTYAPDADKLHQQRGTAVKSWNKLTQGDVMDIYSINWGWQIQLIGMQPGMTHICCSASNDLLAFWK